MLGLCCLWEDFSLDAASRGLLFVAVLGLFIAMVSLAAEHGFYVHRFQCCSMWTLELRLGSCGTHAQ